MTHPDTQAAIERLRHSLTLATGDTCKVFCEDVEALINTVEEMRRALEPFGNCWLGSPNTQATRKDDEIVIGDGRVGAELSPPLTVGDFRKARALLNEEMSDV